MRNNLVAKTAAVEAVFIFCLALTMADNEKSASHNQLSKVRQSRASYETDIRSVMTIDERKRNIIIITTTTTTHSDDKDSRDAARGKRINASIESNRQTLQSIDNETLRHRKTSDYDDDDDDDDEAAKTSSRIASKILSPQGRQQDRHRVSQNNRSRAIERLTGRRQKRQNDDEGEKTLGNSSVEPAVQPTVQITLKQPSQPQQQQQQNENNKPDADNDKLVREKYQIMRDVRRNLGDPLRESAMETDEAELRVLKSFATRGQAPPGQIEAYKKARDKEREWLKKLLNDPSKDPKQLLSNYKALRKGEPWEYITVDNEFASFFNKPSSGLTSYLALKRDELESLDAFLGELPSATNASNVKTVEPGIPTQQSPAPTLGTPSMQQPIQPQTATETAADRPSLTNVEVRANTLEAYKKAVNLLPQELRNAMIVTDDEESILLELAVNSSTVPDNLFAKYKTASQNEFVMLINLLDKDGQNAGSLLELYANIRLGKIWLRPELASRVQAKFSNTSEVSAKYYRLKINEFKALDDFVNNADEKKETPGPPFTSLEVRTNILGDYKGYERAGIISELLGHRMRITDWHEIAMLMSAVNSSDIPSHLYTKYKEAKDKELETLGYDLDSARHDVAILCETYAYIRMGKIWLNHPLVEKVRAVFSHPSAVTTQYFQFKFDEFKRVYDIINNAFVKAKTPFRSVKVRTNTLVWYKEAINFIPEELRSKMRVADELETKMLEVALNASELSEAYGSFRAAKMEEFNILKTVLDQTGPNAARLRELYKALRIGKVWLNPQLAANLKAHFAIPSKIKAQYYKTKIDEFFYVLNNILNNPNDTTTVGKEEKEEEKREEEEEEEEEESAENETEDKKRRNDRTQREEIEEERLENQRSNEKKNLEEQKRRTKLREILRQRSNMKEIQNERFDLEREDDEKTENQEERKRRQEEEKENQMEDNEDNVDLEEESEEEADDDDAEEEESLAGKEDVDIVERVLRNVSESKRNDESTAPQDTEGGFRRGSDSGSAAGGRQRSSSGVLWVAIIVGIIAEVIVISLVLSAYRNFIFKRSERKKFDGESDPLHPDRRFPSAATTFAHTTIQ